MNKNNNIRANFTVINPITVKKIGPRLTSNNTDNNRSNTHTVKNKVGSPPSPTKKR